MVSKQGTGAAGFTLIEILVVLIVVGLLASLAVFTLGGSSQQRQLENQVQELYLLMQTAGDQAVLNNQELGVTVNEDGYQFLAFQDQKGDWKPEDQRLFSARTFPDWLVVTKFIENDAPKLASGEDRTLPDIVFFSSGETTPFQVEFTVAGNPDQKQILESDGVSGVQWRKPGEEADR
ncbi:general secretion pathway protein H [Marinobacter santoriniensis NKSG1]|uniref:Type II secretion system protein H n=1 Tax=Marinobacter santoriniensis NKSG1 TaxID=1288826 RepID=M7CT27_9GAMM|nr:general secretion pathway protein H [Marinobacter santoriniensis NKSG1]